MTGYTSRLVVAADMSSARRPNVRKPAAFRQAQIAPLLAANLSYSEIGRRLSLHHATVMYHARKIQGAK